MATPLAAPVTLTGAHVCLEPLGLAHLSALCEAGNDPRIWTWYPFAVAGSGPMRKFIEDALNEQCQGKALPFVIRLLHGNELVGSTRFGAIEATHRRAEIGWTWLTPAVQRTAVNTECKYLLLRHAFETLDLVRVEFKTDSNNAASRAALKRIGAVEEGTLRSHMITHTGRIRNSVYFSIVREEWPAVRDRLERKLASALSFPASSGA